MYARVPFWCIVLVLFGPFLISSDGIHDLVSTKWEQNDGWMFSPPILTSCSCFLFTPSVCRMPLSRRWWTSGSAIGSPYRLSVNRSNKYKRSGEGHQCRSVQDRNGCLHRWSLCGHIRSSSRWTNLPQSRSSALPAVATHSTHLHNPFHFTNGA